jgi:hypothetical protein
VVVVMVRSNTRCVLDIHPKVPLEFYCNDRAGFYIGFRYSKIYIGFRFTGFYIGFNYTGFYIGFRYSKIYIGFRFTGFYIGFNYTGLYIGFNYTGLYIGFRYTGLYIGFRYTGLCVSVNSITAAHAPLPGYTCTRGKMLPSTPVAFHTPTAPYGVVAGTHSWPSSGTTDRVHATSMTVDGLVGDWVSNRSMYLNVRVRVRVRVMVMVREACTFNVAPT